MMNVIFEGPDNAGKGTQIRLLNKYMTESNIIPFHVLHYSGIKNQDPEKTKNLSYDYYDQMFKIIQKANYNFILDRSHIGEAVYSPLYRGYSGNYVFDIEKAYNHLLNKFFLFVFTDTPENLIRRDDGLSFSTQIKTKKQEIELFKQAFEKTNIPNKYMINCSDGIESIHLQIVEVIKNATEENRTFS